MKIAAAVRAREDPTQVQRRRAAALRRCRRCFVASSVSLQIAGGAPPGCERIGKDLSHHDSTTRMKKESTSQPVGSVPKELTLMCVLICAHQNAAFSCGISQAC